VTDATNVAAAGALMANGSVAATGAIDLDGNDLENPGTVVGDLVVDGAVLGLAGVATDSSTSISMTDAESGKVIRCTAATAITITAGGSAGCTVEYLQEGAGQIEVVAPAGTIRIPATFVAKTAEQWSSIVVTCLDSNEWLVRGDLEPA
jgi:hypothetical protein